jgi:hypothetical protein
VLLDPQVAGSGSASGTRLAALGQLGGLAALALQGHASALLAGTQSVAAGAAAEQGAQLLLGALAQRGHTGLHLAHGRHAGAAASGAHLGGLHLTTHTGISSHLLQHLGELTNEFSASVAHSLHLGGNLGLVGGSELLELSLGLGGTGALAGALTAATAAALTTAQAAGLAGQLARALAAHLAHSLTHRLAGRATALAGRATAFTGGATALTSNGLRTTHTYTTATTGYHF